MVPVAVCVEGEVDLLTATSHVQPPVSVATIHLLSAHHIQDPVHKRRCVATGINNGKHRKEPPPCRTSRPLNSIYNTTKNVKIDSTAHYLSGCLIID